MSEWYGSSLDLGRGVELYRDGSPVEEPYDMSDPLDCAIYCSLQRYLSYRERETGGGVVERRGRLELKSPALLEARLLALRAWSEGGLELDLYTRYWMAHAVLEALFTPLRGVPGGGVPGGRAFVVPPDFWAAEEADLPDAAVPRRAVAAAAPGRTGPLDNVPYPKLYLPLARLLRRAVGQTVGAEEAAELLGLTANDLARRVRDRSLGGVWVGGELVIFEPEVRRAVRSPEA